MKDSKTLVAMQPVSFATEDDFQRLLAEFPSLLAGEQIDAKSPRRWLLLAREKSVPSEEGGSARWSVDHLFVDQEGVPTLVEVKRQSDTRLRREVVGQMLDYAANGVVYWPVDELRSEFERACNAKDIDAEVQLKEELGVENAEAFWKDVKTHLQAGRIRMLFVADYIPPELRRIVEFLNNQMDPAEVLALELRQYEGEGLKTLVPTVYGRTEEAQQKKSVGAPKRQWDEASFFADLEARQGSDVVNAARLIAEWMKQMGPIWYGQGSQDGSMGVAIHHDERDYFPFFLWTYGRIEIAIKYLMPSEAFKDEAKRKELLNQLNRIERVNLPPESVAKRPSVPLAVFTDQKRLSALLTIMGWVVGELRKG